MPFSLRFPDYTAIFQAELLAAVIALRRLDASLFVVAVIADTLSLSSSLTLPLTLPS